MTRLRVFLSRLRAIVRGRKLDDDMRDQILAHLEEATDEYIRQGMSPEEARRTARLHFGSVAGVEEAVRDARGRWHRDLSHSARARWGSAWRSARCQRRF